MKEITRQSCRYEIVSNIWITLFLLGLGVILLDGGGFAAIALIAFIAYWLGAIYPIFKREKKRSDRIYLKYGLVAIFAVSFTSAVFLL